jgi:hypothetical protein
VRDSSRLSINLTKDPNVNLLTLAYDISVKIDHLL